MLPTLAFSLGDKTVLGGPVPWAGGQLTLGNAYGSVSYFLNLLLPLVFVIAGIILFFLLIGGGFAIIASGGNAKSVEQGKGQITGAIIGFLVIFAAYWIIQLVTIITGVPILTGSGL